MNAPWRWYACVEGEHDCYGFESPTREEALAAISREFGPGTVVELIEAKFSTAAKYEGADFVPFIRTKNHEKLTIGPRP